MINYLRRLVWAGTAALLVACGGSGSNAPAGTIPLSSETDIVLGKADAPLTLIEYAALTCGACGTFNNTVLNEIKEKYVETGRLKIINREVIYIRPAEVNLAGYAVARCAGPDKYYAVIDDFFKNQTGILTAVRAGAGTQALKAVASRHGIDDAAYDACLADPEIEQMIKEVSQIAQDLRLGTPTLYLNGRELGGSSAQTVEGLTELLDAELAKGE